MQKIPFLKQQAVRDLAWAIFAPNLIDDYSFHQDASGVSSSDLELTAARLRWLIELDRDPSPLHQQLERLKSTRLGIYFEALWRFFISEDPTLTLLAANLPVYQQKKTLGEFDIIYRDESAGSVVHLELATKYYLNTLAANDSTACSVTLPSLSNWLGPNTKDRLDLKLQRLLSHQIRLSELDEGRQLLASMEIEINELTIAMKGSLFYQPPGFNNTQQSCAPLNPNHRCGTWLTYTDFIERCATSTDWHVLQRPQWISPALIAVSDNQETGEKRIIKGCQIAELLHAHFSVPGARPLMLCAMTPDNHYYHETARYMITQRNWPAPDE